MLLLVKLVGDGIASSVETVEGVLIGCQVMREGRDAYRVPALALESLATSLLVVLEASEVAALTLSATKLPAFLMVSILIVVGGESCLFECESCL